MLLFTALYTCIGWSNWICSWQYVCICAALCFYLLVLLTKDAIPSFHDFVSLQEPGFSGVGATYDSMDCEDAHNGVKTSEAASVCLFPFILDVLIRECI